MCRVVVCLACVLCGLTVGASAQPEPLGVRLSPTRVYVGSSATYTIVVDDADGSVTHPDIGPVDGLSFQRAGISEQTSMSMLNGRTVRTRSLGLSFSVTPTRAGEFIIPPQTVVVDGVERRTRAARLVAVDPPLGAGEFVINVPRREVYVGEALPMTMAWVPEDLDFSPTDISFFTGLNPEIFDDLDDPTAGPATRREGVVIGYNSGQALASMGVVTRDNRRKRALGVERLLVPKSPGTHTIGSASVRYSVLRGVRAEPRVVRAEPVEIRVLRLPREGRPAGFTGLVARDLAMSASVSNDEVNVGDPVLLSVTVRGDAPIERVTLPAPEELDVLDGSFRVGSEGWETETDPTSGTVRFTTMIRPSREGVDAVPAIELSYFNAAVGVYETASTEPVPLRVRETREVTAEDAIGEAAGGSRSRSTARLEAIRDASGGIHAITTDTSALVGESVGLRAVWERPWLIVSLVVPVLAPVGVLAWVRARSSGAGSERARRRRALRAGLRALREGTEHGPERGLRAYLAVRYGLREDAVTSRDALCLLRESGSAHAEEASRLLADLASRRFGGEPGGASGEEVRALLRRLEQEGARV